MCWSLVIYLLHNHMASETKFPQTATGTDSVAGGESSQANWNDPTNACADDASSASTTPMHILGVFPLHSKHLKLTEFGFEIPASATIDGIEAHIKRRRTNEGMRDLRIQLIKGGTVGGSNKAKSTEWTTSDVTVDYGDEEDLWGLELTPSDVNSDDFGIAISASSIYEEQAQALVNVASITVYYTESGATEDASSPAVGIISSRRNPLGKLDFPFGGNVQNVL